MKKFNLSMLGAASALTFTNVFAAVAEPEPPAPPPAQCNITFATGPANKGFSKVYANYHSVCPQVPTCEQNSEGAVENLDLLVTKKADVAFTGAFTLSNMLGSDEQYKQLQVVASLHSNLLHIVTLTDGFNFPSPPIENPKYSKWDPTNKEPKMVPGPVTHVDINKFSDLKGKNIGLVGSAQFIVRKLDRTAGHAMTFVDYSDDEKGKGKGQTADQKALADLKEGKLFAVLTVAAWPHGVIDKLKSDSGFKLVNYDLQPTPPLFVAKRAYKGLGQFNVELLGEPNLLITRPFSAGGENAKLVASIRACIAANLGKLKDGKFEPAWNEVNDLGQTYNLSPFVGAKPSKK